MARAAHYRPPCRPAPSPGQWQSPARRARAPMPLLAAALLLCAPQLGAQSRPDLTALSLEELLEIEVTTVAKTPTSRFSTPAAVYVLTREDIARSGATTLPELLRRVPGVQVQRVDGNKWAVGIRGFASRLSRSILVMIDGRNVYSPLFAGAYWEVQDTFFDDIDRIEVILGPGGSLWGTNAVNGVINIITKDARDTRGSVARVRAGSEEYTLAARHGARTAAGAWRVYGKVFERAALHHPDGNNYDDWRSAHTGFRLDSGDADAELMVQGDVYVGMSGQRIPVQLPDPPYQRLGSSDAYFSGADLLARWTRRAGAATWQWQAYYDRTVREEPIYHETRNTVDLDLQRHAPFGARHELIWGLGYRLTRGETTAVSTLRFEPPDRTDQLFSAFAEAKFALRPETLWLTLGSKIENNDYSGFEWQPNLRLAWLPAPHRAYWLSVSRAVRIPSRLEHDLRFVSLVEPATPTFVQFTGNREFSAEEVIAYEAGQRLQLGADTSLELSLFYNQYRDFLSQDQGTPFAGTTAGGAPAAFIPFTLNNLMRVDTRGGEVLLRHHLTERLRLSTHYAHLVVDVRPDPASTDALSEDFYEGGSPEHAAMVRVGWNPRRHIVFDLDVRYVGALPSLNIPDYATADVRLAYWFGNTLELAVVGRDLLEPHHPEFPTGGAGPVEVKRSAYATAKWYW